MPPTIPGSADASNKFEDLSGVDSTAYTNPYDALIEACNNDPIQMQTRYATHRTTRNAQQKEKLLSSSFLGMTIDSILQRLVDPSVEPGFTDPRHCLVFWARPPPHIKQLAGDIQQKLLAISPKLWLMPLDNMHLTALEITHSLTSPQIHTLIAALPPSAIAQMTDYTFTHRARLIKPMISYDGAALALSFLPAASTSNHDDTFTYHHLRRDLFNIASAAGVKVESRYVVPSSHITLARFLCQDEHDTPQKMEGFIAVIERINGELERDYWPKEGDEEGVAGEWIVGQGKGLDAREGTLWYGGGTTIRLGKGF